MRLKPALLVLLLSSAGPVVGQESAAPPTEPGAQQRDTATLEELVATIEDPAGRQKLVDQLRVLLAAHRAQQAAAGEDTSLLGQLSAFFTSLSDEVGKTAVALIDQVSTLPRRAAALAARLEDEQQRAVILADAARLGGVLLAALAGAVLAWYLTRRTRARLATGASRGPVLRILRGLLALLLDLIAPAALAAITFAGLALFPATTAGRALALALLSAMAAKWVTKAALEFLLAPAGAEIRALPLQDDLAARLARSLDRFASLAIYGFLTLEAAAALGAGAELLDPLRSLYGLLLLFAGVLVVMKYRAATRGEAEAPAPVAQAAVPPSPLRRALTTVLSLWWVAAIAYMVGIYSVWMSPIEGGFGFALRATVLTAAILAGLALAILAIRKLAGALGSRTEQVLARVPMLSRRVPRYVQALRVVLDVAVSLLAAGLVLNAWGVAAIDALASPHVREVIADLLEILLTLLVAAAVIDVATAFTQGYLVRTEREGRASGKIRTLVPLAQRTIKFVVVVIAGITVLSQLGMDIAPILAGVGVLGLAVGFGAQTLVKDVITGAFMLIEDVVSVGDVVQIDGTSGVVEAISIRTIRLRDAAGNVHTIPFSSVGTVTNMTKDYSRYVIECGVAYREDVDAVIAVLKEIGEGLRRDPLFGPDMIEPLEVLGLERFEESAVVIRARLITRPGRQWHLGREFNRRMKRVFDERGIEIPFPHQTIYMGQDKAGKAPPLFVEQRPRPAGAE